MYSDENKLIVVIYTHVYLGCEVKKEKVKTLLRWLILNSASVMCHSGIRSGSVLFTYVPKIVRKAYN